MKTLAKSSKKNIDSLNEVSRLLKNMQSNVQEEASTPFIKSFLKCLVKEADELPPQAPEDFTPEKNKEDFEGAMEPSTPEGEFDIQGVDPQALADAISSVQEWSTKLDQFVHFLNDPKSQSLHKLLADFDRPGSLVKGITRKTSDGITRVAGEIAKLKQTLDGFINLAPKKQRDTEALVATGAAG
jgi:hypothetical protein